MSEWVKNWEYEDLMSGRVPYEDLKPIPRLYLHKDGVYRHYKEESRFCVIQGIKILKDNHLFSVIKPGICS